MWFLLVNLVGALVCGKLSSSICTSQSVSWPLQVKSVGLDSVQAVLFSLSHCKPLTSVALIGL
jgi:hypothetical protein